MSVAATPSSLAQSSLWGNVQKTIRQFTYFYSIFFWIGCLELGVFLGLLHSFAHPSALVFTVALLFFTLFAFLMLRLYWVNRRPEKLCEIVDQYLSQEKQRLRYQEGTPEDHLALAQAAQKLSRELRDREYSVYPIPSWLSPISTTLESLSAYLHWEDLLLLRELLLQSAIDEHIAIIRSEPTNLEIHAALANAYVLLSNLYAAPMKGQEGDRWLSPARYSNDMRNRFTQTAKKAIEEFQILRDYAPHDPWVQMQLAYSYHDLGMPCEEIEAYEMLTRLQPDDPDTLFKLGSLYFSQGMNGKGLHIYEQLKHKHFKRAEALIQFYGTKLRDEIE